LGRRDGHQHPGVVAFGVPDAERLGHVGRGHIAERGAGGSLPGVTDRSLIIRAATAEDGTFLGETSR
jgi:hypothetical protein